MKDHKDKVIAVLQNSIERSESTIQQAELSSDPRGTFYSIGWTKWGVALLLSAVAHASISGIFLRENEPVKFAGGATLEVAVLGNAFADVAKAGEVTDEIEVEVVTETQTSTVESDNISEATQQSKITPETTQITELIEPDVLAVESITATPFVVEPIQTAAIIETNETVDTAVAIEALSSPSSVVLPESVPDAATFVEPAEVTSALQPSPTLLVAQTEVIRPSIVKPILSAALTETVKPVEPPKKAKKKPEPKEVIEKKKPTKKKINKKKPKKAKRSKKKKAVSGNRGKAKKALEKGIDRGKKNNGATRSGKARNARQSVGSGNITNYKGKIRRKIIRNFRPGRVKDMKRNAVVRFTVSRNGRASSIRIARSSGSKILDAAAIRAVRSASPFPPIPSSSSKSSLKVVVPMSVRR